MERLVFLSTLIPILCYSSYTYSLNYYQNDPIPRQFLSSHLILSLSIIDFVS
jgi:hypothetical protein